MCLSKRNSFLNKIKQNVLISISIKSFSIKSGELIALNQDFDIEALASKFSLFKDPSEKFEYNTKQFYSKQVIHLYHLYHDKFK